MSNDPGESGYEVGYRRPPKDSQFKPGMSGNRHGRRKGTKNFATLVQTNLQSVLRVSENGRPRKITKIEAALIQLANKAAAGDPKATDAVLKLAQSLDVAPEIGARGQNDRADEKVIAHLVERIRARPAEIDDGNAG